MTRLSDRLTRSAAGARARATDRPSPDATIEIRLPGITVKAHLPEPEADLLARVAQAAAVAIDGPFRAAWKEIRKLVPSQPGRRLPRVYRILAFFAWSAAMDRQLAREAEARRRLDESRQTGT